jgi:hypothetical protein
MTPKERQIDKETQVAGRAAGSKKRVKRIKRSEAMTSRFTPLFVKNRWPQVGLKVAN